MTILMLFLLAHLIADFPLQTKRLVEWKKKHIAGLIVHSGVFYLVAGFLLMPFLNKVWPFITLLTFLHLLIDWLRVLYIKKRPIKDTLWFFLLDQALHLASILLVSPLVASFSKIVPSEIERFFNLNLLVFFTGFIFAAFTTPILVYYLKSALTKEDERKIETDVYGLLERSLIFFLIVLPGHFYLFSLPVLLLRWRLLTKKSELTISNLLISPLIVAITGLIIRGLW